MTRTSVGSLPPSILLKAIKKMAEDPKHDGCGCALGMEILALLEREGY